MFVYPFLKVRLSVRKYLIHWFRFEIWAPSVIRDCYFVLPSTFRRLLREKCALHAAATFFGVFIFVIHLYIPTMDQIQSILQNQILKAAEEQLDAEIEKLDQLTEDDLEDIRRKRIQEMKERQQQSQQWKINVRLSI